jgi:hypothetical protein
MIGRFSVVVATRETALVGDREWRARHGLVARRGENMAPEFAD